MAKDSQIEPKLIRKKKSNGGPTMAESALDGETEILKSSPAATINPVTINNNFYAKEQII